VGHIGSCLSVADVLAVVYSAPWFHPVIGDRGRDRFVLGKGHAGLALYCTLEGAGVVSAADLDSFGEDGTGFGVHPETHTPGVDFATGSLGQGLGFAVGAALAARVQRTPRHVVALLSDAECNSGATWEAADFAGHHRLAGLVCIVDANGQQALGATRAILDQEPLAERWRHAGWSVREVDGHDHAQLAAAVLPDVDGPVAVVARSIFGKGVPYMERQLEWHYLPMSPEQYDLALRAIEEED
jgi:transketolase